MSALRAPPSWLPKAPEHQRKPQREGKPQPRRGRLGLLSFLEAKENTSHLPPERRRQPSARRQSFLQPQAEELVVRRVRSGKLPTRDRPH